MERPVKRVIPLPIRFFGAMSAGCAAVSFEGGRDRISGIATCAVCENSAVLPASAFCIGYIA